MKNLKQTLISSGMVLAFGLISMQASAQDQLSETDPTPKTIISADKDPGNPHNPPIFSVNEEVKQGEVSVYPNPSNGSFNIELSDLSQASKFVITDMSGRVVYEKNLLDENQLTTAVDLGDVKNGIYLLNTGKKIVKIQIL